MRRVGYEADIREDYGGRGMNGGVGAAVCHAVRAENGGAVAGAVRQAVELALRRVDDIGLAKVYRRERAAPCRPTTS